ncbi:alpha/beta hydrolase family protein [Ancylobacter rudongensis]|uniref:Predicted dienelactone hydrolase n=1 Tax=Ancylobacter rudongensis TaxID=177413 RepID=A0A1G4QPY4_9HYPH|nr:alpha/beta fold hydrolase [Ancylobacter rudongensis]SCW46481.1 Predicted dienelactone hydrolase [Ancylobacter rudongensis]
MRITLVAVAWLAAMLQLGMPAFAGDAIGFRQFQVAAGDGSRKLDIAVWYPTQMGGDARLIGDNVVFVGQEVLPDAPPAPGRHPLVVLSHGFSGNLLNQAWLAVDLAKRGYVVAAVNHPGTTSRNMDKAIGRRLWERPRDISHVIDELTRDPAWAGVVSPDRVAAIGHSLGGWTVLEIAGARFNAARFDADCRANAALAACEVYGRLGAGADSESRAALEQDLSDPRVKAVVSLDLGLARGFEPESLGHVGVPVLVMTADGGDARLPATLESRHLADGLPSASTRYIKVPGATHFSFLNLCKPGGREMLEREVPGDGMVCLEAEGASRAAIHQQVADEIAGFLDASLPPQ